MWPFSKKKCSNESALTANKKVEVKVRKVVSEEKEFDVGFADVQITFSDKRKFINRIYGESQQKVSYGWYDVAKLIEHPDKYQHPTVGEFSITMPNYRWIIELNYSRGPYTFTDDSLNPKSSIVGSPIKFDVIKEGTLKRKFKVYKVVETDEVITYESFK